MLLDLGMLIPLAGRPFQDMGAHHNLAWELSGDPRFSQEFGTLYELFGELSSVCHESVILSSEDFGCVSNKPEVLKSFLNEFRKNDYQVKLIVYLRDPFDYAVSLWTIYQKYLALHADTGSDTSIDGLRRKIDLSVFVSEIADSRSFSVTDPLPCFSDFDYCRLLENYEQATGGVESVLVRAYSHDVIGDFSALIGLSCPFGSGAIWENQSVISEVDSHMLRDALKRQWPVAAEEVQGLLAQRVFEPKVSLDWVRHFLAPSIGFIPDRKTDVTSWRGHLSFVPAIMHAVQPTVFVELGVHKGDSYSAFCQAVRCLGLNTKCYGVDTWAGDHQAGFYDEQIYAELKNYHDPRYAQFSTLLRKSFDDALSNIEDGSVDLLHIGGLHTYEAVKHDFESWLPKLSDKSVVLFHDTVVRHDDFGVWKFWAEVEKQYPAFQFFHSHGLGVLRIGGKPQSEVVAEFFQLKTRARVALRHGVYQASRLISGQAEHTEADAQQGNAEVEQARGEVEQMRVQLAGMLGSRSWRITAPLRASVGFFRNVKNRVKTPDPENRSSVYRVMRKVYRTVPLPMTLKTRLRYMVKKRIGAIDLAEKDYQLWIRYYDKLDESDKTAIRNHIAGWESTPLISVIMPVYNPPVEYLRKAIESVRQQLYPNWELCIADDASVDPEVGDLLRRYAALDDRIKLTFREKNGHISAASNSALALAAGEFVALLDQDDVLAESALYWVAHEIILNPHAQLIYSDEDKLNADGERKDPYFKPAWNPELLLGQNYICHLAVFRRERMLDIGGLREGMEGSQDWDLALRFSEGLAADQILHIPAVLYHWRVHAESTAASITAKPYAVRTAEKAVGDHLQRLGERSSLEPVCGGAYLLPHFTVQGAPMVSLIIPTRDHVDVLRACIESLQKTRYPHYEIIVVDNQSCETETLAYLNALKHEGRARVLRYDRPFNYAALHNWVVPQAQGEFVCLLNNDVEVITPDWLTDLLALAQRDGVGAVGAKLLYPDGSVQHAGVVTGIGGVAGHLHIRFPADSCGYAGRAALVQDFSVVTGACLLVRKVHWSSVDGMTETLSVALNDVDFCLKLREMGLRNVWMPAARLYHHESKSRGSDFDPAKLERFALERAYMQWRWGHTLMDDPAYNPNLSLADESCLFASPPRRLRPWADDLRAIDTPHGIEVMPLELLNIEPESAISGSLVWPRELTGMLRGLLLGVGAGVSKSRGLLRVEVSDGSGKTASGQVLIGEAMEANGFVRVLFPGPGLSIDACERLHYRVEWSQANHVLSLCGFRLNECWEHQVPGHPGWVGRMRILMSA
ncbi:hypothetical protein BJI67_11305 [Acidihalobacter aeolianus]|uniref:Glycosyltransferase 2-like domain-containing protein n=2 Tax=Acidihalobacter aeolianus TaxID=2792603 RepID=A0A1D8K9B5_9GAMM|nr:hypothetical protein BJI67_11305 [Acidihalobacter aeolianus]